MDKDVEAPAEMLCIRSFKEADADEVVDLWKRCGLVVAWNDPYRDIERKRSVQREFFLIGLINGKIVASVMAGYDGHRGWLNYLAVDPGCRSHGYGKHIVEEAEKKLALAGCPKINLQVRAGNKAVIEFYTRLGYRMDEVVSLGKRIDRDQ